MDYDVILRGGEVLDGTGALPVRGDVGVRDGRIAAVGNLGEATAATVVDATARVVAPGFIDVHAHTDLSGLLEEEHVDVKAAGVRQGVTTEVCGNCGYSPFPSLRPAAGADPYLGLLPEGARRYFPTLTPTANRRRLTLPRECPVHCSELAAKIDRSGGFGDHKRPMNA